MVLGSERRYMGQTARFQDTLRRLAMIDEGFVEDQAGLRFGLAGTSALDARIAALLQVAVSVAIGSPTLCLGWSVGRALAAGATEDEIADVLLAITPVAGSAGSPPPLPMWRSRSGMTSRRRSRKPTVTEHWWTLGFEATSPADSDSVA